MTRGGGILVGRRRRSSSRGGGGGCTTRLVVVVGPLRCPSAHPLRGWVVVALPGSLLASARAPAVGHVCLLWAINRWSADGSNDIRRIQTAAEAAAERTISMIRTTTRTRHHHHPQQPLPSSMPGRADGPFILARARARRVTNVVRLGRLLAFTIDRRLPGTVLRLFVDAWNLQTVRSGDILERTLLRIGASRTGVLVDPQAAPARPRYWCAMRK